MAGRSRMACRYSVEPAGRPVTCRCHSIRNKQIIACRTNTRYRLQVEIIVKPKGLVAIAGEGSEQHLRRIAKTLGTAFINFHIPERPDPLQQVGCAVNNHLFGAFDIHLHDIDAFNPLIRQKIIQLDDFLADQGIESVDVVKMDVEGAEQMVVDGAPDLLKRIRPLWYVEIDESRAQRFGDSAQMLFATFTGNGYKAFRFDDDFNLQPVSGIGAASDYLFVPN